MIILVAIAVNRWNNNILRTHARTRIKFILFFIQSLARSQGATVRVNIIILILRNVVLQRPVSTHLCLIYILFYIAK